MRALFIDGVGRMREAESDGKPTWHVPVPAPIGSSTKLRTEANVYQKATFERIGTLTDGRLVYGQVEAKLKMWTLTVIREDVAKASELLQAFLNDRTAQPAKVLIRRDTPDGGKFFEGVARRKSTEP